MKTLFHSVRANFLRFRAEIIGYWIFAALLILGHLAGQIGPEPFPFLLGPKGIAFNRLEFLAVAWLTLRLMLSEPVFRAQGGWRVRPLGKAAAGTAPFLVIALVLLPPVLLRVVVVQMEFAPGLKEWMHLLTGMVLPVTGWFLLGALLLNLVGPLVSRVGSGKGWKIASAVAGVALLVSWYLPQATGRYLWPLMRDDNRLSSMGPGSVSHGAHVLGIQELLPENSEFAGDWMTYSPPVSRVREVFRFPVSEGMILRRPGLRVEVKSVMPQGDMMGIDFSVATMDPVLIEELWRSVMVVRYRGDVYALRPKQSDWKQRQRLLLLPGTTLHLCGFFDSPLSDPTDTRTWKDLTEGMELIFYFPDKTLPKIQRLNDRKAPEKKVVRPVGLAGEVEEIFDKLDHDPERSHADAMAARGETLTREAMPFVLSRHPWSDIAWSRLVKPFLMKHASEADKPALLGRMSTEPRLGEVLVTKGWKADAMPLLRRFAEDRLPLDVVSLSALAEEKDASLAVIAAGLEKDADTLEQGLRDIPGFDWRAFVNDGWLRRKYEYHVVRNPQPFSFWAAREGNVSAFRYTAMQAARGGEVEKGQLASLVAGAEGDLHAYLRENIDRMEFDAGRKQWSVPR